MLAFEERQKWLSDLESYERDWRDIDRRAGESHLREDSLLTWTVGLSTAALAAIGPALHVLVDLGAFPRRLLLVIFGPFLVSLVAGLLARITLQATVTRGHNYAVSKLARIAVLKLRITQGTTPVETIAQEMTAVIEDHCDERVTTEKRWLSRWGWATRLLSVLMYLGLLVGLVIFGWIVLHLPPKPGLPG